MSYSTECLAFPSKLVFKRDSAVTIPILTVIPTRLVPMIANLSVGMSMKLVSMHVLVVTVKTAAAMEIGVEGNQTQS